MEELLHTTIKNLHSLHLYPISESEEKYEQLLIETVQDILQLFNYDDKYFTEVNLSVSPSHPDIGAFSFLFYVDKNETNSGHINDSNILQYVQSNIEAIDLDDNHLMKELLKILSRHNKDDSKKPVRLKDSYSLIVYKFSQLVEFFNKFRTKSDDALESYLHKCFVYEAKFSSTLRNQLGYGETEKIVEILDSFISMTQKNIQPEKEQEDNDSIFSYEDKKEELDLESDTPLGFHSSDPNFMKLYQIFLQITSFKNDDTDDLAYDYSRYIRLMINFYKKHNHTQSLELNSFKFKELKLNFFYNFLVGESTSESESPLLPIYFRDVTKRVLAKLNLFPEMNKHNNYLLHPATTPLVHTPAIVSQEFTKSPLVSLSGDRPLSVSYSEYSKDERALLISLLKRIIPLLNEFNLNFNPDFPTLFQYYLNLVYDDFVESTEQADFQYVDSIVKNVNSITEFENEDDSDEEFNLKDVVYDFYKDHQLLLGESNSSTLLMKLAINEFDADTDLKRSIITQWNFKTLRVSQLEYNMASKFLPGSENRTKTKVLSLWFGKAQRFKQFQKLSENYYDKQLTVKVLKNHWIPSLITLGKNYQLAQTHYQGKVFRRWLLHVNQIRQLELKADHQFKQSNLGGVLQIWTNSYNKAYKLGLIADQHRKEKEEFQNDLLKRNVLNIWFTKLNSSDKTQDQGTSLKISEKLALLSQTERQVVLKKFFEKWKKGTVFQQIFHEVSKRNNHTLKLYFFKYQWHKKLQVNNLLKEVVDRKNNTVIDKTFQHWKNLQFLRSLADSHYNATVSNKALVQWKLQIKLSLSWNDSQKSVIKHSQLKLFFHKWKLAVRFKVHTEKQNNSLVNKTFRKWFNARKRYLDHSSQAIDFEARTIQQNQLARWFHAFKNVQALVESSDLHIEGKYFKLMLNVYKKYNSDYEEKALQLSGTKAPLNTRIILASTFKKWQQEYHQRFEVLAIEKAEYYINNVSIPNRKYTFLSIWVKKYNERYSKNLHLDQMCDQFIAQSTSKRNYFNLWVRKTKETADLREKSETFEANLLSKKFILIWYDLFVNKGLYLNDLADENISQKDFVAARNILSKWSMKYIKTIKRNQQTCDMFIERWEASRARAILDLWVQKTHEKMADDYDHDYSLELSDTSMVSNLSPLANKSVRSAPNQSTRFEGNSSYLYTPIKLQIKSPATPHNRTAANGPSPSKLQETNMKLKLERIESLRRHFGRAKGHSTPLGVAATPFSGRTRGHSTPFKAADKPAIKNETVQLTMPENKQPIRLSPPKSRASRMPTPPKAPDFKSTRSQSPRDDSPEADFTQAETYSKATTTLTSEEEEIESAKRLRKITPIYFPQDDAEPRFSPLSKIREKYQGRERATNSESFFN